MRRRTARAIAKARKCALGGSVGPAPKSEKITGEFRNPAERAHGQPWLRPWYMSPRRAEESVGTRRPDDGPLIVPRVHSIARRADGGPVDEFAGLDPIAREAIRVENRGTRDPEQMVKNSQINQDFVLDNTPVVGNVRSARRALDSGSRAITAKHYGHTGKFRQAATEFVLDAAGAFAPLPWGRRAGEAAREGSNTARVFVPVRDERLVKAAQDARLEGATNEEIFKNFNRSFFSPEGRLKRQIDDSQMTILPPDAFAYGDSMPVGKFAKHPELFAEQPKVAEVPLTFRPDDTPQRRGLSRTNPQSGNFELSLDAHDPKWYRRQLAKLMQYRVGQDARFSGAMRHGARNVLRDLDTAHGDAALLLAQGKTDPWAAGAYMRHLEGPREAMRQSMASGKSTGIERKIGENSAGNVEAALVRSRVDTPHMNSIPYQPKQPGMNRPMGTPSFGEMTTLPPSNATLPEVDQFLREWYNYGAGREHKFARGGRVKRAVARGKAITGGIRGKTGGREDALPVDVPAGAYVIPADVVAALGGGNTEAGMHALDKKFGRRQRRAAGGRVPILISDGEYVLSPEAVEAAGGNDRLDELVVNTRKAYARHLAELPGPNQ